MASLLQSMHSVAMHPLRQEKAPMSRMHNKVRCEEVLTRMKLFATIRRVVRDQHSARPCSLWAGPNNAGRRLALVPDGRLAMQIHEIMTASPVTCTPETSLGVAAGRMAGSKCGMLPVVDTRGRLVGIITDRDICLAMSRTNRNALSISVREVMTRKVSSVQLGDDVRRALALMRTARVRRVPVLDAAGHLEGVLSIDDIIGCGSNGDIRADEIVETLRDVYVRRSRAA
jgi:CBS domain-containing protein